MGESVFTADCLAGKTALITGGSSGIGAAAAVALDRAGADVVICARRRDRLSEVAASLSKTAITIEIDLSAPRAGERLAAQAIEQLGRPVDILVNAAGFGELCRTARLSEDRVDAVFSVNVRAALMLASRLVPHMAGRSGCSIINVSSVTGRMGTPFQAAYAATKGALDAVTRSLAREYAPMGVRVNAVAPGMTSTEMHGANLQNAEFMAAVAEMIPLRTWATPEMIADVIVFLASPAARYITGQVIVVDGGLTSCGDLVPPRFFASRRSQGSDDGTST